MFAWNIICNVRKKEHTLGIKEALYIIWCGVNRLGDSGVKVV